MMIHGIQVLRGTTTLTSCARQLKLLSWRTTQLIEKKKKVTYAILFKTGGERPVESFNTVKKYANSKIRAKISDFEISYQSYP